MHGDRVCAWIASNSQALLFKWPNVTWLTEEEASLTAAVSSDSLDKVDERSEAKQTRLLSATLLGFERDAHLPSRASNC